MSIPGSQTGPGGSQGREPSRYLSRFNLGGRGYIRATVALRIGVLFFAREAIR